MEENISKTIAAPSLVDTLHWSGVVILNGVRLELSIGHHESWLL